jgi:hypothetical protein
VEAHYISAKFNTMKILVNHNINNPQSFWESAQASLPELPVAGVNRILQVMPNSDMTQAACLWDADSVEKLDSYLRSKVGDWSKETYMEVNETNAMGVPA